MLAAVEKGVGNRCIPVLFCIGRLTPLVRIFHKEFGSGKGGM